MNEKCWYHNALIWSGILIILIILGFYTLFQTYKPNRYQTVSYNHFDFIKAGGLWNTEWQKGNTIFNIRLRFNPYDVKNVSVSGIFDPGFNKPTIYITFDPEAGNFTTMSLAAAELSINMVQAIGITPIAACATNITDICTERPIIKCGDTNKSVIYLLGQGESGIAARGTCIILLGEGLELLKSVDRLLYAWYNIMPVTSVR